MGIPSYLKDPLKGAVKQAESLFQTPYMPYYGPEVAAFSPMQNLAFGNNLGALGAFGMLPGVTSGSAGASPDAAGGEQSTSQGSGNLASVLSGLLGGGGLTGLIGGGLPAANMMGGLGYSSAPIFEQALGALAERQPNAWDSFQGFFSGGLGNNAYNNALRLFPVADSFKYW